MDLDNLLNTVQQEQLAQELSRVMSRGFGVLEMRIEKGCVRWLRPGLAIYGPLTTIRTDLAPHSALAEVLGPWLEPFTDGLAKVMGDNFGTLVIGLEHGSIRYIMPSSDVRFRTGKTGDIGSTTSLHP